MIPLPLIPLLLFTRDRAIMGDFVNRRETTMLAIFFAALIIGFDMYLLVLTI
jgi:manganese transport protein